MFRRQKVLFFSLRLPVFTFWWKPGPYGPFNGFLMFLFNFHSIIHRFNIWQSTTLCKKHLPECFDKIHFWPRLHNDAPLLIYAWARLYQQGANMWLMQHQLSADESAFLSSVTWAAFGREESVQRFTKPTRNNWHSSFYFYRSLSQKQPPDSLQFDVQR